MAMFQYQLFPDTFCIDFHNKASVRRMRYSELGNTGLLISHLGFGASPLGNVFEDSDQEEDLIKTVGMALKHGVNYIDTAPWYGQGKSEENLGKALKDIPRKVYYIGTKVGRYELEPEKMFDFSAEKTLESVEKSLSLLGLEYIDIIQIHDVEYAPSLKQIVNETIPALLSLRASGKVRYIGITGYNLGVLKKLVRLAPPGSIDTVLSYCRCTLFNQDLLDDLEYFQSRGIGVINAAPVAMGLLSHGPVPSWHPALPMTKECCARAAEFCTNKGVNIAKLAVKWTLNQQVLTTTLLGAAKVKYVQDNLASALDELSDTEQFMLDELKRKFFDDLVITQWENIEPRQYWDQVNK